MAEMAESPSLVDNAPSAQSPAGNSLDHGGEFLVFPNADDSIKLSEELHVDPKLMRKMERRAERDQLKKERKKEKEEERERRKEQEKEAKERERMFGGRKMSAGLGKLFKRRKSDEIPYPEVNFGISNERQVENAGMF